MRRLVVSFVLAALVATLALPQAAAAAKTTRILVHFDRHASAAAQKALIARVGGRRVASIRRLGTAVVTVPAAKKKTALALLQRQPTVTYAQTDGLVHMDSLTIDDTYLNSSAWQLANPHFADAWSLTTGSPSVIVAVLDTGVQPNQQDLGTLVPGYDFVNNDSSPADDEGHGTAVAGIIAAQGNNGQGVAGVCWGCRIMPVKVLGSNGYGTWSAVASGIVWATDHGANVINMSLGSTSSDQTTADAIAYAEAHGVVVVAAAGNDRDSVLHYPADYPGVISVGAVDQTGTRYSWSDFGSWVQVDAPGCTFTTALGSKLYLSNFCGTSASAPFVSGLAGLALSYRPSATASDVANAIEQSAHLGSNQNSVYGLVDGAATLRALGAQVNAPQPSFTVSSASGTAPFQVTFTNTSTSAKSYAWTFGDGPLSTAASPVHTFTTAGTYTVTLTASGDGGSATAATTITVAPPLPHAAFTASKTSGTAPLKVTFSNTSTNATAYSWSFGDGGSSTGRTVSYVFSTPGIFLVTLTTSSAGGSSTASTTITVASPPPTASFSASRTSGVVPFTVSFTNTSKYASSYGWVFGDGGSSTQVSPSHTFTVAGRYTVVLTATGPGGTRTKSVTIVAAAPVPDLAVALTKVSSKKSGKQLLYAFKTTVTNRGTGPDSGVTLAVAFPANTSLQNTSASGGSCVATNSGVNCTVGTLAVGQSVVVSVTVLASKGAVVTATASGALTESSLKNNKASLKVG